MATTQDYRPGDLAQLQETIAHYEGCDDPASRHQARRLRRIYDAQCHHRDWPQPVTVACPNTE